VTHTLVDLYCGQGHIEKALEVLEKILALNPNDKKTIDKIAEIKSLMGNDQVFEEIKQPEPIAVEAEKSETILPLHKTLIPLEENTVSEEEGRDHLMSLIDETFGHEEPVEIIAQGSEVDDRRKAMEDKLQRFLRRIQQRALDYQSRV
jgi:pentatricopeptide repeat protein